MGDSAIDIDTEEKRTNRSLFPPISDNRSRNLLIINHFAQVTILMKVINHKRNDRILNMQNVIEIREKKKFVFFGTSERMDSRNDGMS